MKKTVLVPQTTIGGGVMKKVKTTGTAHAGTPTLTHMHKLYQIGNPESP